MITRLNRALAFRVVKPAQVAMAQRYLERHGLAEIFTRWPADAISPVPYDLYNLHRLIRSRRPSVVLEFGVGLSSVTMAHAVALNGSGRLYVVDTSERWLLETQRRFPANLCGIVAFHHTPAVAERRDGIACHRYARLPVSAPNFLYLDGPDPADVEGFSGQPISADLLDMEAALPSDFFMVIDGRIENYRYLRTRLRRQYRFRENEAHAFETAELLA
jgi:hypothetical protein